MGRPETHVTSMTFALVKPDAFERKLVGAILNEMEVNDFLLRDAKIVYPSRQWWEAFYQEHVGRSYYETLVSFMCSGPVMGLILNHQDPIADWKEGEPSPAVRLWRGLMGASRVKDRVLGTIRHRLALGQPEHRNLVHGSDSDSACEREVKLWQAFR